MEKGSKPVKAYKGFNKHMQCTPNGKIFQYEIGKEYKEDEADLCHCGFHACENPLDVLSYYDNIDDKFCEVELDEIDPNRNRDSKICGKKIKIGIEIGFLGLFKAGIEWIKNKTIFTKEDFEKLPSGYGAKIGSSGYGAKIGSSGDDCVIMCAGINSSAKAKIGSWITLAEWKYSKEKQRYIPFSVVTKQVDGIEIKEDVYYTLQDGKFKESEQQ
mgnify:CR=1 FL=1